MFFYFVIILVSYLLGSISTSYIITKKISGVDIRTQGSGNAGSTNVLRTLGKKAGIMTFVGDFLKGSLAVFISNIISKYTLIDTQIAGYLAAVSVVLGHNYPVFLGFRGGKGVATSLGSMICMNPIAALSCLLGFIIVVGFTKYISLGSILGIATGPIIMILKGNKAGFFATLFLFLLSVYGHRANIKRLLNGTERKLGEKK